MHACSHTHTHTAEYIRILVRVSVLTQPHDKQRLGRSVSCLKASHGHLMQTNKQDNLQLSLPGNNSNNNNIRTTTTSTIMPGRSEGIWNSSAYQRNDAGSCENIHTYLHASPECWVGAWGCNWSLASMGWGGGCCFIVCQLGDFVCIVCSSNYVFSRQTARLAGRQRDRQGRQTSKQANRRTTNKNAFAWNLLALCLRKQLRLTTAVTTTTTTIKRRVTTRTTAPCSVARKFI